MLSRLPAPPLSLFVERLWSSDAASSVGRGGAIERVVPTGRMHLVVRLDPVPLRLPVSQDDPRGLSLKGAVVGGARGVSHLRDVSRPVRSVGALIRPGAARALLGVPAGELAGTHVELGGLWGAAASELEEALASLDGHEARLAWLEATLRARLLSGGHARLDRRIELATAALSRGAPVGEVARALEKSPRRFGAFFEAAVGLAPKRFASVVRVHETLALALREPTWKWAKIAAERGYADQAHLHREVRAIAGVSPSAFRALSPDHPSHLPVDALRADSFKAQPLQPDILTA